MTETLDFSTTQDGCNVGCTSGVCEIKFSESWNPSALRKGNANQRESREQADISNFDSLVANL